MWSTLALSILGAVMVFSASSIYSLENKGNSFSVIGRQLFFLILSIPLGYLASRQKLDRWKNLMGLIMLGRDLGTTAVFAAILAGLLWVSGVSGKIFGGVIASVFSLIAVAIATAPYRAQRFLVVLDPFAPEDYKNAGWQPAHSLLGLASGGVFGVGLGASRQKWGNLAEAHTDFIFSVIGEELGLFGTLIVLLLFSALIFSIFRIALRAKDPMSKYACAGIGAWIAFQTILNIGSATSMIPVVGVTLPLVSYGGSSLLATYIALGFVLGAARRDPAAMADLDKK